MGSQGLESFLGPTDSLAQVAWMGLALQNAQGEAGPPKKLKTSSLSPPGRGAEASSNGGLKDSGRGSLRRTWWLGQTRASEDSPQALRAWPSSSREPLASPAASERSKPALAFPLGQGKWVTSSAPQPGSARPGLSHRETARFSPSEGPALIKCGLQASPQT